MNALMLGLGLVAGEAFAAEAPEQEPWTPKVVECLRRKDPVASRYPACRDFAIANQLMAPAGVLLAIGGVFVYEAHYDISRGHTLLPSGLEVVPRVLGGGMIYTGLALPPLGAALFLVTGNGMASLLHEELGRTRALAWLGSLVVVGAMTPLALEFTEVELFDGDRWWFAMVGGLVGGFAIFETEMILQGWRWTRHQRGLDVALLPAPIDAGTPGAIAAVRW